MNKFKVCWCTLPLTNPDACNNCSNANYWYVEEPILTTTDWYFYNPNQKTYNPETHDLVEKKEAKINRLKEELENLKYLENNYAEAMREYAKLDADCLVKINDIKEELKQLENQ